MIILGLLFFGLFSITWESLDSSISTKYAEVQSISTDELYKQYQNKPASLPTIIDVREIQEYEVSHLPGALNIKSAELIAQYHPDKTTEIVLYCSVGYRSAVVTAELNKMGFKNVKNLRHSIFEWANKDYPLINKDGDTNFAHPFDKKWGVLLEKSLHRY